MSKKKKYKNKNKNKTKKRGNVPTILQMSSSLPCIRYLCHPDHVIKDHVYNFAIMRSQEGTPYIGVLGMIGVSIRDCNRDFGIFKG